MLVCGADVLHSMADPTMWRQDLLEVGAVLGCAGLGCAGLGIQAETFFRTAMPCSSFAWCPVRHIARFGMGQGWASSQAGWPGSQHLQPPLPHAVFRTSCRATVWCVSHAPAPTSPASWMCRGPCCTPTAAT